MVNNYTATQRQLCGTDQFRTVQCAVYIASINSSGTVLIPIVTELCTDNNQKFFGHLHCQICFKIGLLLQNGYAVISLCYGERIACILYHLQPNCCLSVMTFSCSRSICMHSLSCVGSDLAYTSNQHFTQLRLTSSLTLHSSLTKNIQQVFIHTQHVFTCTCTTCIQSHNTKLHNTIMVNTPQ